METAQSLALIASGVAIATSLGSLGVSFYVAMRDRAHLRIDSSFGFLTYGPELGPTLVQVTVINDGRYSEIVTGVGFVSSTGKRTQLMHADNFPEGAPPHTLVAADSMMGIIPRSALRRQWQEGGLGRMTGVFAHTRSGRTYTDKPNKWVAAYVVSSELDD